MPAHGELLDDAEPAAGWGFAAVPAECAGDNIASIADEKSPGGSMRVSRISPLRPTRHTDGVPAGSP